MPKFIAIYIHNRSGLRLATCIVDITQTHYIILPLMIYNSFLIYIAIHTTQHSRYCEDYHCNSCEYLSKVFPPVKQSTLAQNQLC